VTRVLRAAAWGSILSSCHPKKRVLARFAASQHQGDDIEGMDQLIGDVVAALRATHIEIGGEMPDHEISCLCGATRLRIGADPLFQFYCHCDDCQAVHGAAYIGVSVYPSEAVAVVAGEPVAWTYKTMPRHRCPTCGTQMFAVVPGAGITGVKANLLPAQAFAPRFHIQCRYARLPVIDDLPHFAGMPAVFGGADEPVGW
jgi:hypothetical protein